MIDKQRSVAMVGFVHKAAGGVTLGIALEPPAFSF